MYIYICVCIRKNKHVYKRERGRERERERAAIETSFFVCLGWRDEGRSGVLAAGGGDRAPVAWVLQCQSSWSTGIYVYIYMYIAS